MVTRANAYLQMQINFKVSQLHLLFHRCQKVATLLCQSSFPARSPYSVLRFFVLHLLSHTEELSTEGIPSRLVVTISFRAFCSISVIF